jgi:hypothetical protein
MFPDAASCYERVYVQGHLADHPAQRVTRMALVPEDRHGESVLGLWVSVTLRGVPGGDFDALAYCENNASVLYCAMEGDAGSFQIQEAKNGAVLVSVSSYGMGFENDQGFVTLARTAGDDRSFLLQPAVCR